MGALSKWGKILPQCPHTLENKTHVSFTEQQSLCQKHCCCTLPPTFLLQSLAKGVRLAVSKAVQDPEEAVKLLAQVVAQVK